MATRKLFNAKTQAVEVAELTADQNGEVVATFKDGGFVKFPATVTKEEFDALVEAHEAANVGQVTVEATNKLLQELADEPAEVKDGE